MSSSRASSSRASSSRAVVFAGVVFAGVVVDFVLVGVAAFEGVDVAGVELPDDAPASRNGFSSEPRRVMDVTGVTAVSDVSSLLGGNTPFGTTTRGSMIDTGGGALTLPNRIGAPIGIATASTASSTTAGRISSFAQVCLECLEEFHPVAPELAAVAGLAVGLVAPVGAVATAAAPWR